MADKLSAQFELVRPPGPKYSRFKLADEYNKALPKKEDNIQPIPTAKPEDAEDHHFQTGIMIDEVKGNKYQCRCVCHCGHSQTVYIPPGRSSVSCRSCKRVHKVRNARAVYMTPDKHNNFFIAGKFIGHD